LWAETFITAAGNKNGLTALSLNKYSTCTNSSLTNGMEYCVSAETENNNDFVSEKYLEMIRL
jgi:hypothetical protein